MVQQVGHRKIPSQEYLRKQERTPHLKQSPPARHRRTLCATSRTASAPKQATLQSPCRRATKEFKSIDWQAGLEVTTALLDKNIKVAARSTEEEADVGRLEKMLGLTTGRRLPKAFYRDGLASLLDGIRTPDSDIGPLSKKRKRGGDPSRDFRFEPTPEAAEPTVMSGTEDVDASKSGDLKHPVTNFSSGSSSALSRSNRYRRGSFGRRSLPGSPDSRDNLKADPRPTQNPPAAKGRQSREMNIESLQRCLQGLINKLSSSNIPSVVNIVESLHSAFPLIPVHQQVLDLVLSRILIPSRLDGRFSILLSTFLAAIYRTDGESWGLMVAKKLVKAFDKRRNVTGANPDSGKQSLNLVSIMAYLFTFEVLGPDFIGGLLLTLANEPRAENLEFLLEILKGMAPSISPRTGKLNDCSHERTLPAQGSSIP